jgi:hypothetical protein
MGPITSTTAIMTTRSRMHGMPSARRPPLLFGIPHSQQGPRAIGPVAQFLYDRFQPMLLALGLKVLRELSE